MKFKDYSLIDEIKDQLDILGFKRPTDIQHRAIKPILDGEDVMVQAGGDGWEAGDIAAAAAAGADVGASDGDGCNGVWNAARYGHAESLAALLAAVDR